MSYVRRTGSFSTVFVVAFYFLLLRFCGGVVCFLSSWLHWTQRHQRRAAISNMAGQEDPVQREIHQDWANREYIEVITSSIKKIADFLNSFGKNFNGIFHGYPCCCIKIWLLSAVSCRLVPLAALFPDVDASYHHSQLAFSFIVSRRLVSVYELKFHANPPSVWIRCLTKPQYIRDCFRLLMSSSPPVTTNPPFLMC